MSYICVDLDALARAAHALEIQIQAVEGKQREILRQIDYTQNAWDGPDADLFESIAESRMKSKELEGLLKGLKNQRQRLLDSIRLYQNAQGTVLGLSGTL